jgi:hypothetical protein
MLFDRRYVWSEAFSEYTEAASGAWLGQPHSRAVTFVSPSGAVFSSEAAPLIVEVLDGPPEVSTEAESVGEFDLLVPSGELVMEESGGGGGETVLPMPPGEWRARWSGFGETAAEARDYTDQSEPPPVRIATSCSSGPCALRDRWSRCAATDTTPCGAQPGPAETTGGDHQQPPGDDHPQQHFCFEGSRQQRPKNGWCCHLGRGSAARPDRADTPPCAWRAVVSGDRSRPLGVQLSSEDPWQADASVQACCLDLARRRRPMRGEGSATGGELTLF